MIIDILRHTPFWVFLVLALLVFLGARRIRPGRIPVRRLYVLPLVMTVFSLVGTVQAFGAGVATIGIWVVAFAALLALGRSLPARSDVQYAPASRSVELPGSWLPLVLMITIFFFRYAVAVALAMHPALHADPTFGTAVSGLYGLFAGSFAARALMTWRAAFRPRGAARELATDGRAVGSGAASGPVRAA